MIYNNVFVKYIYVLGQNVHILTFLSKFLIFYVSKYHDITNDNNNTMPFNYFYLQTSSSSGKLPAMVRFEGALEGGRLHRRGMPSNHFYVHSFSTVMSTDKILSWCPGVGVGPRELCVSVVQVRHNQVFTVLYFSLERESFPHVQQCFYVIAGLLPPLQLIWVGILCCSGI